MMDLCRCRYRDSRLKNQVVALNGVNGATSEVADYMKASYADVNAAHALAAAFQVAHDITEKGKDAVLHLNAILPHALGGGVWLILSALLSFRPLNWDFFELAS